MGECFSETDRVSRQLFSGQVLYWWGFAWFALRICKATVQNCWHMLSNVEITILPHWSLSAHVDNKNKSWPWKWYVNSLNLETISSVFPLILASLSFGLRYSIKKKITKSAEKYHILPCLYIFELFNHMCIFDDAKFRVKSQFFSWISGELMLLLIILVVV